MIIEHCPISHLVMNGIMDTTRDSTPTPLHATFLLQRAIGVVFSKILAIRPTLLFPSGLAKQPRQINPFVFVPLFKMHWTRLVHQRGIKQHHSIPLVRYIHAGFAIFNFVLVIVQSTVLQQLKFFERINSKVFVHNHATR